MKKPAAGKTGRADRLVFQAGDPARRSASGRFGGDEGVAFAPRRRDRASCRVRCKSSRRSRFPSAPRSRHRCRNRRRRRREGEGLALPALEMDIGNARRRGSWRRHRHPPRRDEPCRDRSRCASWRRSCAPRPDSRRWWRGADGTGRAAPRGSRPAPGGRYRTRHDRRRACHPRWTACPRALRRHRRRRSFAAATKSKSITLA